MSIKDNQYYLVYEKLKSIVNRSNTAQKNFLLYYRWTSIKRFFIQTTVIFAFQYLIIINLDFKQGVFPFYPPLGVSFVLFYLLGTRSFWGIFFGEFMALFLKGLPPGFISLTLISDIFGGYIASRICHKILLSDIQPFADPVQRLTFIKTILFKITPFTSFLKLLSYLLPWFERQEIHFTIFQFAKYQYKMVLLSFINLWLSDSNGIFILSAFLLSWVYVFNSREKISSIPIIAFMAFITFLGLFINPFNIDYLLITAMGFSIIWSFFFGYLVSTLLLFILSCLVLVIFQSSGFDYPHFYSILLLFFYYLIMMWVGHKKNSIKME